MSPEVPLHKLINKLEENWESSSDDGWEDDDIDLTEDDNEDDVVTYRLVEYLFMRIQSLGIVVDEGIKGTIDFRQKSLAEPSESNFLEHESTTVKDAEWLKSRFKKHLRGMKEIRTALLGVECPQSSYAPSGQTWLYWVLLANHYQRRVKMAIGCCQRFLDREIDEDQFFASLVNLEKEKDSVIF